MHKLGDGATLLCLLYYPLSLKVTQKQLSSLEELLQTMSMVGNDCELKIFHDWQRQLSSNLVKPMRLATIIVMIIIIISIEYVHSIIWALHNETKGTMPDMT